MKCFACILGAVGTLGAIAIRHPALAAVVAVAVVSVGVMLVRGEETNEILKDPDAFVLLTQIATRAKRNETFNIHGLEQGEALIGDYRNCGLTERRYRTSKHKLEKWGKATFRATNKGTIAKLTDASIYDLNLDSSAEQSDSPETSERRTSAEQGDSPETTNKKEKNERRKEDKKKSQVREVFDFWNKAGEGRSVTKSNYDGERVAVKWRRHRLRKDGSLSRDIEAAIQTALNDYNVPDVCEAIDNYARVLFDPASGWTYVWALPSFLGRKKGKTTDSPFRWWDFLSSNFNSDGFRRRGGTNREQQNRQSPTTTVQAEPIGEVVRI